VKRVGFPLCGAAVLGVLCWVTGAWAQEVQCYVDSQNGADYPGHAVPDSSGVADIGAFEYASTEQAAEAGPEGIQGTGGAACAERAAALPVCERDPTC
jgi:hypothetical protein